MSATISAISNSRRLWMLAAVVLLVAACGGSGGSADNTPPPPVEYSYRLPASIGDGWSIANAADQGVEVAELERMMNAIRGGAFDYIDAVAVAQGGRLVLDETIRTTTDIEDDRVANTDPAMHRQFSVSKSITSLAVGIAIDDGYIAGADTRFLDLFDYPGYANWDDRKNDITLEHVLAMRAGLEWDEWDPPYTSPDNQLVRFIQTEFDYTKSLLDLPLAADPGSTLAYNTIATIALVQAIDNRTPLPVIDYGINELLLPMGISEAEVLATPTGLPNGGSGFYLTTRDIAKFGQLLLDGGTWNGERIVSAAWIDASVTPQSELGWSDPDAWDWQIDGYGYQWWTGHYDFEGREVDSWVAWGFGGQWIIAIPEFELVVAINAHGYDGADTALNQGHMLVRNYILPAM